MASNVDNNDDDSFIVLGTSPGSSIVVNGIERFYGDASLDHTQLDDALKDLSDEASKAFKAHFKLDDTPSPASLMVASNIITDDKSVEDLQKHFGEILDENLILKETLKKTNEATKEQFLVLASCQEDMMKTHMVHKEKFDETRELVEKLRQENKKLKQDIARLTDTEPASIQPDSETGENSKSGPSSALEFVTSPDDDTINKLTAQLELVEKQRRQVIVENDKLSWQKESLEHIVDATTKERDDLKEKIKSLELQLLNMENEYAVKINTLSSTVKEMHSKMQAAANSSIPVEEITKRDADIKQLEGKVTLLQSDLKTAQLKILEMENIKLEFSQFKSGVSETSKIYKDQIQELKTRLREAQTTVFQPVRFSVSESDTSHSEYGTFMNNVKLYDKTLKHLADLLNLVTHGASDSLVETLGVVTSLHEYKLDRATVDQFKSGLSVVKQQLEKQHTTALSNIAQVRGTLTIFEGIFKDYNELLKKVLTTATQEKKPSGVSDAERQLTAALLARGRDLQALQTELTALKSEKEDREVLKTQLDVYKLDFEAEREAREKMASEKENLLTDLRSAKRRIQELLQQLDEVRKLNPNIYRSATSGPSQNRPRGPTAESPRRPATVINNSSGNVMFTCPKCMSFTSNQYRVMEDHFDFCLDDF